MLLNNPCILKMSVCLKHSQPNVCTKVKFQFFTAHCQPAYMVQTSVDYQHICVDLVSSQSLVSLVERQSRLVELNDALLPSGSTTADLHSRQLTPASQGDLK